MSSLKAVFFTMTPSANTGKIGRSKTQFIQRKLNAILNQACTVSYPGTEAYFELMHAWNIAHKSMMHPH